MRILLMFILFVFAYASAQDCSKIEDNNERLSCYDSSAKKDDKEDVKEVVINDSEESTVKSLMDAFIEISDGQFSYAKSGLWVISSKISPVDDSKFVALALLANDEVSSSISKYRPMMVIRCSSNKTEVMFNYKGYLGRDSASVTYRIDKEKAVSTRWNMSNDSSGAFVVKPIQFIKSLFGKNNLYVSITPYSSNSLSTTFDITGLEESVEPLKEACGW